MGAVIWEGGKLKKSTLRGKKELGERIKKSQVLFTRNVRRVADNLRKEGRKSIS